MIQYLVGTSVSAVAWSANYLILQVLRQVKVTSDPKSSFFEGKGTLNLVKTERLETL